MPDYEPLHLLVETPCRVGDLQYPRGAVIARVGHALDAKNARPRITLGILPERQHAIERRAQFPSHLDEHVTIAQVILRIGLRIVGSVESQTLQVRTERVRIDVRRPCIQDPAPR